MMTLNDICNLLRDPAKSYIDSNIIIKEIDFEMVPGYPYVLQHKGSYGIGVVYGNNCTWFFEYLMRYYFRRLILGGRIPEGWLDRVLNHDLKERIKPIPDGLFEYRCL